MSFIILLNAHNTKNLSLISFLILLRNLNDGGNLPEVTKLAKTNLIHDPHSLTHNQARS